MACVASRFSRPLTRSAGENAHLREFFWKARFWNNAYAVVSVGGHADLAQLLDYIQDQERPPG